MSENGYPESPINCLPAVDPESGDLITVVETPKGFRNKFKFEHKTGLFKLSGILPAGAVFPFDFGFIPSTLGEDGDPLDVLILMDEPAFTGCIIPCLLIGVIQAVQKQKGEKKERNDRLIAVSVKTHLYAGIKKLSRLQTRIIDEIEHFFISYNQLRGRTFTPVGRYDSTRARKILQTGINSYKRNGYPE
ncbi:MAG: inorganic diphosphatase [Syntrophothermus sp.]